MTFPGATATVYRNEAGEPDQVAAQVVKLLREEAKII